MALARRLGLILFILLLLVAVSASARIISVPSDQPTLADAFANLIDSDTVYIQPGEYSGPGFESLSLTGVSDVLVSAYPDSSHPILIISEDSTFVNLSNGVSVTFVDLTWEHGFNAIYLSNGADATVTSCLFDSCRVGVYASELWSSGHVEDCMFIANGWGIIVGGSNMWQIDASTFWYNGNGVMLVDAGFVSIRRCLFHHCFDAIECRNSDVDITQSLLAWNSRTIVNFNDDTSHFPGTFTCNNVWGSRTGDYNGVPDMTDLLGNISSDPLVCDSVAPYVPLVWFDPRPVTPLSPCLPENNDCGVNIGNVYVACDCCRGTRGNVDYDPAGVVDISDLTRMISDLFITLQPPACESEADVTEDEAVDIADLTRLINHLFITFEALPACEGL